MQVSRRSFDAPKALRSLGRPTRLRILELLHMEGPLTATETAELADESPANCSWHLRQRAYGFVEELLRWCRELETLQELAALRDAITNTVSRFAHRVGSPESRP